MFSFDQCDKKKYNSNCVTSIVYEGQGRVQLQGRDSFCKT